MAKKTSHKKSKIKKSTLAKLVFLFGLTLLVYTFYLNHMIVSRFEQRRWNLPSRIYSDSFALYDNRPVSNKELQDRLIYLNYHNVSGTPQGPGEYYFKSNNFIIYLHDFDYPHEKFTGFPVAFDLIDSRVKDLHRTDSQTALDLVMLEPELIASIFDDKMEDRTFVSLATIPKTLIAAVVLIEDERFYSHHGIDPIGIMRAFLTNITHAKILQGGSTLTQQMVKNFFLTSERTLVRKVNEMIMALLIEVHYSKEQILEVYLNEVYFGQRHSTSVTGVQEAARLYFSKDVAQLNIAECALIAALMRSPGLYSPFSKPENALNRRAIVIKKLFANKMITKKEFDLAIAAPLPQRAASREITKAAHFADFVRLELAQNFPREILTTDGLRLFTTLDAYAQRLAQHHVEAWLNDLEKNRDNLKKNAAAKKMLQAGLVSLQSDTGFVRAYIGGRDYATSQFDVISQGFRQPGSTFKPFVYLTALDIKKNDSPFTLASLIADEPISLPSPTGPWRPQNYDKKFHGLVTLKEALTKSYNVATVTLAKQIGFEQVVDTAKHAGVGDNIKAYGAAMLGAFEITPLNLASAYTVFPNRGTRSTPLAIRRVVTADGQVLEKKSIDMKALFSEDVIFLMNKAMEAVLDQGTARSARTQGLFRHAAGKTGTTSDYRDAWFVGFTPELVTLTWVGYLDNEPTQLSGASGALPLWTRFIKDVTANLPNVDFVAPDNIIIVPIDKASGKLYRDGCGERVDEYFIEGTEPTESC